MPGFKDNHYFSWAPVLKLPDFKDNLLPFGALVLKLPGFKDSGSEVVTAKVFGCKISHKMYRNHKLYL